MGKLEELIAASERENTRRSYASAVRHFEGEWQGVLPTTTDAIARYLADFSATLSINTLRQRLAALSRWHADHGFSDPTKGPLVRQVLRGIRSVHPAAEKQARPLAIAILQQVDSWLEHAGAAARSRGDFPSELRYARNRSLVLLGFWRGFRSDEIVRLRVKDVEIVPGEGLTCYLGRSKGDRQNLGREFKCPALSQMCPVSALSHWKALAGLESGPLYRGIDRWGHLSNTAMAANSLVPLLRALLDAAGVPASEEFSSHSLRRGFASWARDSGWDLKELMNYVGWRDVKSAMRYLDTSTQKLQTRFEQDLPAPLLPPQSGVRTSADEPQQKAFSAPTVPLTALRVKLSLSRFSKMSRGLTRAHRLIEKTCLERYAMQRLNKDGTLYTIVVPSPSREELSEAIYTLLDDMYRVAGDSECTLEATVQDIATGERWE